MDPKLSLRYDQVGDILHIDTMAPYAEQDSEEVADEVIARLNPNTGEVENLEVLFWSQRLKRGEVLELPLITHLRFPRSYPTPGGARWGASGGGPTRSPGVDTPPAGTRRSARGGPASSPRRRAGADPALPLPDRRAQDPGRRRCMSEVKEAPQVVGPFPLSTLRHSVSHLMASAVAKLYPGVQFGFGPSIEHGFYYDFDLKEPLADADLRKIEKEMARIAKRSPEMKCVEVSRDEAIARLSKAGQAYKIEAVDLIPEGEQITFYHTATGKTCAKVRTSIVSIGRSTSSCSPSRAPIGAATRSGRRCSACTAPRSGRKPSSTRT